MRPNSLDAEALTAPSDGWILHDCKQNLRSDYSVVAWSLPNCIESLRRSSRMVGGLRIEVQRGSYTHPHHGIADITVTGLLRWRPVPAQLR